MIPVTKAYFPEIERYTALLERIWKNGWLTNRGELILELEERVKSDLGSVPLIIMNNGTIPIQIALRILAKKGEVITTPFSYVATSASIVWENCKPVFVDIDTTTLTIDTNKIREKITDQTTCILATHVFGNPCDLIEIDSIAKQYNLSVIYDAAHCYGVRYKGKSIFNYGDVSTCSFHATKVFHTAEGGAFFTSDDVVFREAFQEHNFGHLNSLEIDTLGTNAKISELQAAMGLAILPSMSSIFLERKRIVQLYTDKLKTDSIQLINIRPETDWNYSYFPVIFKNEETLLIVMKALSDLSIFPRRYFYPSLNNLPYVEYQSCPISESISRRILCLPLYVGLSHESVAVIAETINMCTN